MIYSVNTGTCTSLDIFPYYTTTGTGKTWNYKKWKTIDMQNLNVHKIHVHLFYTIHSVYIYMKLMLATLNCFLKTIQT